MGAYGEEPLSSDAEFQNWLDREVEQAHRAIAAAYDRARREAAGAHAAWPPEDEGGEAGGGDEW